MTKRYRPFEPKQQLLLPPNLEEWLPEDHLARFVRDVVDALDLGELYAAHQEEDRGYPPYDPRMMTQVMLYAYAVGVPSSRRIECKLVEDVAFRYLAAGNAPGHRTIAEFRRRHLAALAKLFVQVLQLCQEAGLVKLGHVALDSTKIKANASKHKAMSYERLGKAESDLKREIAELLGTAEATDAEEDRRYGRDRRGDELPEELARREKRLAKIQEAKRALEAKARTEADHRRADRETREAAARDEGRTVPGYPPRIEDRPDPKAQRNFTDPDSGIMKGADGFVQAYNCQAAVDAHAQVIVACEASRIAADSIQVEPMVTGILDGTGELPRKLSADRGFFSEANAEGLQDLGIDAYVAVEKDTHRAPSRASPHGRIPRSATMKDRMRRKLRTLRGKKTYARRKAIVEPVFGQIKNRGYRQFLLRGQRQVEAEWNLICTSHNLLKLFRGTSGRWSTN